MIKTLSLSGAIVVATALWVGGLAQARPSTQPASAPSKPIRGVITLGKKLESGTLFLILRPKGAKKGPPIAVRRYVKPKFPLKFELDSKNVMIPGTSFEGPFDLFARMDQDGNAMTKQPGDMVNAKPVAVRPGDLKVKLALDKQL